MKNLDSTSSNSEILGHIKQIFVENFEIDASDVVLDAKLYDDLDIDSIDAVDLMIELKKRTGKKIDPDAFKQVSTVEDVAEVVLYLLRQ